MEKNPINNLLRRRIDIRAEYPNVPDGEYRGKLKSVMFKEVANPHKNNELQEFVHVGANVETKDGIKQLCKRVAYSWYEKSHMYKMLDDLGCLPEKNEDFDFSSLIDMNVTITIKNNTHEGKTYSNIDKIQPRAAGKEPASAPRKANIRKTEDIDYYLDFFDENDEEDSDDESEDEDE